MPVHRVGFSHFCKYISPGNVLAYSLCQAGDGNSLYQVFTRTTSFGSSGGTPTGRNPGSATTRGARHRVEVRQDLSGTYKIDLISHFHTDEFTGRFNWNNSDSLIDLDSGAYDGETPNTFGLAMFATAVNHRADISYIQILQHPADTV